MLLILLKYDLWKRIYYRPTVFLTSILIEFFEPHIIPYSMWAV